MRIRCCSYEQRRATRREHVSENMQKQPALRPSTFALTKHLYLVCLGLAALSCSDLEQSSEPEVEVGKVSSALFANGDFESGPSGGLPSSWTVTAYQNKGINATAPITRDKLQLQANVGTLQTTTLYSASGPESQADATLTGSYDFRWPKFGNYVAYVNMNPGSGYNVNSLKQTMTLGVNDVDPYDGKPHIRFAVAPVLHDPAPPHAANAQPYYFIQVKNTTTNTVLFTDYHYSGEAGVPWKLTAAGYSYTDWQLKDISPTTTQASLGDSVELEVIAASCAQSGHFGRIYVDGVGPTIPGLSVSATAPDSANSNTDIAYDLVFKNGGTGAAGNVVIDFTTPPSTTFTSVAAPGAICTQPSVGATGTVSCTYGLLDIGASNSLRIVAHINSGATGTVTAGNYKISAVNAQALLGATVYTNITSGVTYTDVAITNSNGVGAVNWGQAVTYTITATNRGPAAITNGTLTDTLPNTLTGASWTCTGSGGGTCAAGPVSGNIADATVNLPVNASVTYTLNASVIAVSNGATRVTNTASFTMPGSMADSQSDDNAAADVDPITSVYTLTINKSGNATGTVVSVPNAISCGTSCSSQAGTFAQSAQLILAATPAANKIFTGWSGGGCTGTGNCTVTLGANTTVTAQFDSPPPCAADTDCSSTRYCDGNTLTCQARLPNGSNIPSDTIHSGTCATMGLSCASLLCNSDKCAKSAGAACTANVECASNSCTSSVCAAMPNGSSCGLNSDCTSGSCKSQHCVPSASGCYLDVDCSNTQYCNRATLTCATKLTNGTSIPTDGLHTHICADAAAVCQSGLCNSSTITCGAADGGTCSVAGDCNHDTCTSGHCIPSSNGCWVDGNCTGSNYCNRTSMTCTSKLPTGADIPSDGLHLGGCGEATAVCVSGQCNPTQTTCAEVNGTMCSSVDECVSNKCTSQHCVPASSGCYEDIDCGDGSYCDRSTYSCVSKLAAGTTIPSDTLHTGMCSDAAAVCLSGKCNAAVPSCGVDNGTTCLGNADCVNNKCTNSHCVPPSNGCWADGDCASGNWCDRSDLTCKPTLGPGVAIPNDGVLHDGNCTPQNAQAVCTGGECNTTTKTCASPTSTDCTDANQCVSNTCTSLHCVPSTDGCFADSDCTDPNKYCDRSNLTCTLKLTAGTAIPEDGLHHATCVDAPAVCRSGDCNTVNKTCAVTDGTACGLDKECISDTCSSGHCVPATGGCWDDVDCDSSDFCDRANLLCKDDLVAGVAIPDDDLHGGGCADAPAVCQSQLCNAQAKTCATDNGTDCGLDQECVSQKCTSDHCVPSSNGCWVDDDCASDKYCDRDTLTCAPQRSAGESIPDDGYHEGECDDAVAVCVSDKCNTTTNTCALDNGESCADGDECVNNVCTSSHCVAEANGCWQDSDCPEGYCDRSTFTCKSRIADGGDIPDGDGYHAGNCNDASALCVSGKCNETTGSCASDSNATCTVPEQCTNNVCDPNNKCGIADGGNGCTTNNGSTMCQSGTCAASGRCVPSGGDGCYIDSDCESDEYCERSSLSCKPKLDDGTAIPSDGLHDGRCTQPNAQATCVSGGCNANQNTCASKNGEDCSSANECIRNICGSNNKCGYTDGAGPCTQGNAKFVCQSGACSSTGNVCVPALNKSCAADSDCAQNAFCDAISGQCTPDLSNGQTIPSDGLHNGLCTQPNAMTVCTSGYCNVATSQCAAPLGAACINATECAANICGSNGKCGRPDGAGPCTSGNAAAVCQSASCSLDGTCVEAGHCTIDADCAPDRFCDGATTLCTTRLPPGSPIPTDGDHDGTCPSSGLSPVCASGRCLPDTDRCVVDNGADCTDDDQCASNACGSNQKCGLEPEANGCTPGADPSCQSGICENEGVCAEGVACSSDAQCAGDGGFCSDGACLPRLPAGATIPNDTLHSNTCNDPNAAAVCQSGKCNTTTGTCAADRNVDCAVPAQCASNICGANGKCGLPDGAGPCTTNDAATRCQSQTCSPNTGTCIAVGGCGSDAECSAGKYCDGETFTCVDTLEPGSTLPDDGLHDGMCSSQNARVCQSAGCNSTTNTCALDNSESCLGAAECASNLCASDGKCGARDGEGHCTPGEASECRSNTCSASTLVCVPQVDGCASPNDCDADEYCDAATHTCKERKRNGDPLPTGTACPASGVTRDCASGLCLQDESRCVAPLGDACTDDVQCRTGVCGENDVCGIEEGGTCTPQTEEKCQSQNCGSGNTCDAADSCNEDADCPAGNFCDGVFCHPKLAAGVSVATDALHDGKCTQQNALATCQSGTCNDTTDTCAGAQNAACDDASACVSNACGADGKCGYDVGEGPCTSLSATTVCRTGLCSVVGVCLPSITSGCAVDSDCGSDAFCDLNQHTCVPKLSDGTSLPSDGLHDGTCSLQSGAILCASGLCNPVTDTCARLNGAACSSANTCVTNVCGQNNLCGLAEGEGTCTTGTTLLCQTLRCSGAGVCIKSDNGCAADADCSAGNYCDPAARSCRAKLAAGAPLPNDSLHNGACSSTLAALVCETGQCNAAKSTCAAVNGGSCNAAAKCVSDACGDNGRCGLNVGEPGCTSLNQAQTCQSSYCSASGTCVPPAGCNVDSDCSGGTYCNRTAHVCEALLRDGKQLPNDGLHAGKCTQELATVVCASGMCNSTTDTCAAATSSGCTSGAQCVTNLCGDNSSCGLSDGAGPCTDDGECQSGECQVDSGRCVASDSGCTRDEDCAAEAHCNLSLLRCEADLDDGTTLPGDSDSGGKCTAEVAKTLCASGVCNAETDQCAAIGGSECNDDSECASNLCAEGRCGSADGNGQCTQQNATSACQSGVCQGDLYRCVAAKNGCTADSDCPTGNYCDGKTLACVPRLASGAKLPSDEMHSAECTEDVAAAVCGSGACNARTNACALVVGEPCQQATDCASNACLDSACVETEKAPPAFRLTGGRCSIAWVQAGSIGPSLALLWLAAIVLRRRARSRPKR